MEAERQVFLASAGLKTAYTPRSTSFCAQAMLSGEILEVRDASKDPRFADFALVKGEAHVRFYAGAPLISAEGAALGALCAFDTEPRPEGLTPVQREGLLVLADAVKRRLLAHRSANKANAELRISAQRLQFMLDSVPDIAWSAAPGPVFDFFNARFGETTGAPPPQTIEGWRDVIHPEDFDASAVRFREALLAPQPFEDEWRLRQADGGYRWVLSRAVPSSDDPLTARWFGTLTDIDEGRRVREEREMLAGELAHRIKNIFTVVIGLISLNARGDAAREAFAAILADNIRALSRAQEYALEMNRIAADDLAGLIEMLMEPYRVQGTKSVRIAGDAVEFGPRAATPLALVFHELATNSAKYGALSVSQGTVTIAIERRGDEAVITWQERGGPEAKAPETEGFGSRLVTFAIARQLAGRMTHNWEREGLRTVIELPLEQLMV
ncbi:MAG: PAS domain-containing protein [Erythrobacter sp.]|nr:PAS domain-containing protein [Erythrobacter sp.]